MHHVVGTAQDHGYEEDTGFRWVTEFQMLQCGGCQEVVLRRSFNFSENQDIEVRYFPPPMSRHPPKWRYHLPRSIMFLLDEIYRSLDSENLRLPMMGARALVDMLMTEKVGDVGGFQDKLKALHQNGFLSARNVDTLYAVLEVGNAAAHRGHAASESEVEAVMDIVENLLQAVYVFPKSAKRLKDTTPSRSAKNKKAP